MLQTFTGRAFNVLAPRVEDIVIEDIAHALSLICRFGGHISSFYSVSQHSVLASVIVPPEAALWALLHDASEAYLGDVVTPLKETAALRPYKGVEAQLQRLIYQAFGLSGEEPEAVRAADVALVVLEADALLPGGPQPWIEQYRGTVPMPDVRILPVPSDHAERAFLKRFRQLTS